VLTEPAHASNLCWSAAGGACKLLLMVWQALACFALPCALVYVSEKRSRRIFTQGMAD
jgi:hypothetical protein